MDAIPEGITPPEESTAPQRKVTTVALSKLIGSYWLFVVIVFFIFSLLMHHIPLLLLSLLFFLVGGVSRLWNRYCLSRVDYKRRLSANRVFFGEDVQLELEIVNRKPLPLPWIQIEEEIPEEVTLLKGEASASYKPNRSLLSNLLSLTWYHKVIRRYPIRCLKRGYFTFGPTFVSSGDLFGFFNQETEISDIDYLMVYPKILPMEKLGIPSKQPFGDIRIRKHMFQDPMLTSGIRDYQPGDSLKYIHWKSSARRGELQTKVFEQTTTIDMGIFLDVRTIKPPLWGTMPQLLEAAIIVAASISNYAMTEGYRVGLYANQTMRSSNKLISLPPSQHKDQLRYILEALAHVHLHEAMPIEKLVMNETRTLHWGSTIVVISAAPDDSLLSTLIQLKKVGRSVALISIGDSIPPLKQAGITVYNIDDEMILNELETLKIEN